MIVKKVIQGEKLVFCKKKYMKQFVLMLEIWDRLLNQLHKTSKALQEAQIALSICAKPYTSLLRLLRETRVSFGEIEHKVKEKVPEVD